MSDILWALVVTGYIVVGFSLAWPVIRITDKAGVTDPNDPTVTFSIILWPITLPLFLVAYFTREKEND